jgi:uncharacterized protein YciI
VALAFYDSAVYFLVLLQESGSADDVAHEPFIDSLVERNLVLLGGDFDEEAFPGVTAAYVLRCGDLAEAEAVVATDPLVASGACEATVVGWDLVGVNLNAIDPYLASGSVG